jgi:hypothetical protein
MSEELNKRLKAAMLGFTQRHGLEFRRWNERTFCLKPAEGLRSAEVQINFESGFWHLYGQVDEQDLPALHQTLLRQLDGYKPGLRSQFVQTFFFKAESIRNSRSSRAHGRMLASYNPGSTPGGFVPRINRMQERNA